MLRRVGKNVGGGNGATAVETVKMHTMRTVIIVVCCAENSKYSRANSSLAIRNSWHNGFSNAFSAESNLR